MYIFALLIGIYSYIILLLGILHLIYPQSLFITNCALLIAIIILLLSPRMLKNDYFVFTKSIKREQIFLWILFASFVIVNFIGVLAPELAFDALWYHLTLPKIYIATHAINHIPGGLLYYSDMPKLGEMLFVGGLSMGSETINKLIQFSFGLLTCYFIYSIAKKYFNQNIALFAILIYYGNLVVAWESTIAYIDLIRGFFEIAAFSTFLLWVNTKSFRWFILFSILIGLAISTKLLAIGTLFIFTILIIYILFNKWKRMLSHIFVMWVLSLFVVLPWFLFSYINTGNIVYPFFTPLYPATTDARWQSSISDIWQLFIHESDPLSPIYMIFMPLILIYFSKVKRVVKIMAYYSLLALFTWYITPRTGGGRFILPYLPVFSLLCAGILAYVVSLNNKTMVKVLQITIISVFVLSLGYRAAVTSKYLPVVFGLESKNIFLAKNLNFHYGDFYDTDRYFTNTITESDRVLLIGFHNLYYVTFPYTDSSWIANGDRFNYVATQNTVLPQRFADWQLIHENKLTLVKLYKPPVGLCIQLCTY